MCSASVREAAAGESEIHLVTDRGERIAARLVVAADGSQSTVRTALGIAASASEYGQQAVIAHVDTARFHGYTAYERFTPDGPIAVLPIAEGRSAVVWALAPDAAARALALDDARFISELQRAFGLRLGRFTRVGRRQSYPLALTRSERVTAARAVILGNAAQGLHPVAGQGFNLALRDVAALAELLGEDVAVAGAAADPGSANLLERYAAWRKPDREAVVRFTDSLVRGFGLPLAPARMLRASGLLLFDLLRPVKHEFARRTMGLAGRQPRLVRGLPLVAGLPPAAGQTP
jgi:2-octaprenyl-6-methoxyphenol hydroxylase